MDNVTHTIAGLILAETVVGWRARREGQAPGPVFVRAGYLAAALANNLPDLDFAWAFVTGGKLGYLMHHRGHTHTLGVGALLGVGLYLALARWLVRRGSELSRNDRRWLAFLGISGPLLHVGMDGANVYGVHPLWPLYDGWLYGDSIFIIEPLFWVLVLPVLLFAARHRVGRALAGVLLVAIVVMSWLADLLTLGPRILVTVAALGMLAWARRARPLTRALVAVVGSLAVLATFTLAGRIGRTRLADTLGAELPAAATRDLAFSPFPANPLCWAAIAVQTEAGELVSRRAVVAPFPGLVSVTACPGYTSGATAPLVAVPARNTRAVLWAGEHRIPISKLSVLARDHCEVETFLRFARTPYLIDEGASVVVGDLRFDHQVELGFAEMRFAKPPARCPPWVPGWIPPLADLL